MKPPRVLSVSLAAYDGYEAPRALDSLARLGVGHVEPAYGPNAEPCEEAAFSAAQARRLERSLRDAGLRCASVWAELDLAGPEAMAGLSRRLEFAAALGARLLVVSTSPQRDPRRALLHLDGVSRQVEALGLAVALAPDVEAGASGLPDTIALVARAQRPWLGLDFRTVQALQAQPGLPVADQFEAVRADCRHLHLGDARLHDGCFPVPPGAGAVGCERVLRGLARAPLSLTLELPLRLHRARNGQLLRAPYRVPLPDIEAALARSLAFVADRLPPPLFH